MLPDLPLSLQNIAKFQDISALLDVDISAGQWLAIHLEPDLAASYSFGSQHYPQLSVDCLNH
jgi:hypothetical protein